MLVEVTFDEALKHMGGVVVLGGRVPEHDYLSMDLSCADASLCHPSAKK